MTLIPAAVLVLMSITLAGGPQDFLGDLRGEIGAVVGAVIIWFARWL